MRWLLTPVSILRRRFPLPVSQTARPLRQAVTTGSFGTTDTMVSIAHIMLPQMPRLQKAILSSVDKMFGIAAAPGGQSGWAHIKAQLATEPNSAAGAKLVEGFAHAGMVAPVPDLHLKYQKINLPIMSMAASVLGAFQPQQSTPIEIPVGVGVLSEKSVPIDQAVGEYGRIYHEAQKWIKAFHDVEAAVKGLVPFPIAQLIATVHKEIEKVDQAIRKAVKAQVVAGMVAVIDSMSGRKPEDKAKAKKDGKPLDPKDPDAEFNKDVGDALEYLHEAVEAAEKTTSLESRLKSGDLSQMSKAEVESRIGPVIEVPEHDEVSKDGKKTRVRKYYVSAKPLPPSHSEISKDHEPYSLHQDGKTGDVAHHDAHDEDQTKGSPFFGLARALALESLKHNEAQLQAVWSKRTEFGDTSVFGDKKKVEYENKADPKQSGKIHDDVMTAAEGRGKSEAERSKKEGMAFAQRDTAGLDPETGKLLNLVDFFVSHPDDTSWWKPTFDGYIAADPDSVYDGILRRNRTRGERDLDAPKK